jgi:hypothetical protein
MLRLSPIDVVHKFLTNSPVFEIDCLYIKLSVFNMPHSRNRPQHRQHQQHGPTPPSAPRRKSGSAAIIFAVFFGIVGVIIGYMTVGTEWQLYAIVVFSAVVGFFVGRQVDRSVKK